MRKKGIKYLKKITKYEEFYKNMFKYLVKDLFTTQNSDVSSISIHYPITL
jgi:hypothetical protein